MVSTRSVNSLIFCKSGPQVCDTDLVPFITATERWSLPATMVRPPYDRLRYLLVLRLFHFQYSCFGCLGHGHNCKFVKSICFVLISVASYLQSSRVIAGGKRMVSRYDLEENVGIRYLLRQEMIRSSLSSLPNLYLRTPDIIAQKIQRHHYSVVAMACPYSSSKPTSENFLSTTQHFSRNVGLMLQLPIKDQFYIESADRFNLPTSGSRWALISARTVRYADRQRRIVCLCPLTTIVSDMELGKFKSSVQDGALIYSHWARILPVQGDVYKAQPPYHPTNTPVSSTISALCLWFMSHLMSDDVIDLPFCLATRTTRLRFLMIEMVPEGQLWTCTTIDDQDYRIQVWGSEVINYYIHISDHRAKIQLRTNLNKQHTRLIWTHPTRCEFQWGFFMETTIHLPSPSSLPLQSQVSWKTHSRIRQKIEGLRQ